MKVIGLTGGIASGKSSISKIFEKLGAYIIDADKLAHQIYDEDSKLVQKIIELFGKDILIPSTFIIDRDKLGEIVFKNHEKLKQLETLIHPAVRKKILYEIHEAGEKSYKLCIVDAALLVETGFYKFYDGLMVVKCSPEQQKERLKARNELNDKEIQNRINSQSPLEEKIKVSNWIIDNSHSLEETQKQVEKIYKELVMMRS